MWWWVSARGFSCFLFLSLFPFCGKSVDSSVCFSVCHCFVFLHTFYLSVLDLIIQRLKIVSSSYGVAAMGWTGPVSYFIRLPPVGSGTKLVWIWLDYISLSPLHSLSIFVLSFDLSIYPSVYLSISLLSASRSFFPLCLPLSLPLSSLLTRSYFFFNPAIHLSECALVCLNFCICVQMSLWCLLAELSLPNRSSSITSSTLLFLLYLHTQTNKKYRRNIIYLEFACKLWRGHAVFLSHKSMAKLPLDSLRLGVKYKMLF